MEKWIERLAVNFEAHDPANPVPLPFGFDATWGSIRSGSCGRLGIDGILDLDHAVDDTSKTGDFSITWGVTFRVVLVPCSPECPCSL